MKMCLIRAREVIGTKERDDISNKWFIGQPIGAIWDYKVPVSGRKMKWKKLPSMDSVG
jgi:hypothetical protein